MNAESSTGVGELRYYAMFYHVVDDFIQRRAAYRDEHLRLATEAHHRGELLLAGAMSEPADRTLLVFRTSERAVVEDFAKTDPYVTNGLVVRWDIRPWSVVIGNEPSGTSRTAA